MGAVAAAVVVAAGTVGVVPAAAAASGPGPVVQPASGSVTAQSLPTAQVDGVVWSQAVAGGTVYVGGSFAKARPAGAAPGVNTVARTNLMAYSLATGVMTSFAPVLPAAGQVYAVAVSPDGARVYVAGQFTTVDGVTRNRIAAFDTSTGALVTSFAPNINYTVKALAVTATTVYAGGAFSVVGSTTRNHAAAFDATTGALRSWNPDANATVQALTTAPDGSAVYLGGAFSQVGSTATQGLAEVDAVSGAVQPWAAASVVRDSGTASAILSLTHDATNVYGGGYVYSGTAGNLEGVFASNLATGAVTWVEDCHGDTYGVYAGPSAIYSVGHAHDCARDNGFPDTNPRVHHPALSWTPQATGTLLPWTGGSPYADWGGTASPSLQNWFPDLATGTYTGQTQAAWTVTGASGYVLLGGEFPTVNNVGQQGLARFATPAIATSQQGPRLAGSAWPATATAAGAGTVNVTVPTNWDRDDLTLTYSLIRGGDRAHPVTSVSASGTFWRSGTVTLTDRAAPAGTDTYQVRATDPTGNTADSATSSVAVTAGNQAPTAAFTSSAAGLTLAVDGSGSRDPDGSVASWAWTFGDGGTATGATSRHTYAQAGAHTVTLTVTDDRGATARVSRAVTVGSATTAVARDTFARTVSAGWGSATTGGAWTVAGPGAAAWSVGSGAGRVAVPRGYTATAELRGTSASDTDTVADTTLDQAATGGGTMVFLGARHQGSSYYGMRVKALATGQVQVSVSKVVNGTDTQLAITTVSGLTARPGQAIRMRLQVFGTSTVTVRARAWNTTASEPGGWQASGTDTTPRLPAGDVWLSTYVSSSATAATTTWSVDDLAAVPYSG